ncbi:hypothetical protein [Euzebya sp.]|uniref:hypothetical protein n=1 Tax=Euzebya sp. TaxID=1971409 RepID=UPI003511D3E1
MDKPTEDPTDSPSLAPDLLGHLPIGERPVLDPDGIAGWEIFPYEVDTLTPKVLEPPVLPEPPRQGEDGPTNCRVCAPSDNEVWTDGRWWVHHTGGPTAVPAQVWLGPVAHHDLDDLPVDLVSELGPMLQRVSRAIARLPGVGRVHVNRWGDGAAHLHLLLIARPAGMMQLRGSCLISWDDLLPPMHRQTWETNMHAIAAALEADEDT